MRFLMCMLMTVTLIWGGCLSCSQYFMTAGNGVKSCCHPSGGCKDKPPAREARQGCNIQPATISDAMTVDSATQAALVSGFLPKVAVSTRDLLSGGALRTSPIYRGAPPDLNLLHSLLRV